jgi:phospholipid/cholesterol/gamma-HCH transport system ATP-binding protein
MPTDNHNDPELVLALDNVALGYGDFTVLSGISMQVQAGQVVAVMGGSGSGKTTLLRAATGQLTAQRGTVRVFGEDIATQPREGLQAMRQRMGVLFQQGALFTDLNVFENVAFPLREHTDLDEPAILERVLAKLDAVGLRTAAHLAMSEISGGMARRVALARAVVLEPELILYDEPFAGLDPISLGITARLIRNLSDQLGCASVLITHDVAESFAIADHVYLVGQKKLAASGTPESLRASQDPYVRQFLDGTPDGPVAFQYPDTPAFDAWLARQPGVAGKNNKARTPEGKA